MWNGKSAISALWMVRTRTSLLMLHATLRLLLSWSGCRSWCIICWSSEQNYSRHGMLSYFGCFFQRLARSCKSVRAQNSRGSKTAAFRWGFRFFLGNPGKMDQFRGLETPLSFRYHDLKALCGATKALVPMAWPGRLKDWDAMGRWEHGLAFW